MSGQALILDASGAVHAATADAAITSQGRMVWIHLTSNDDIAKQWLHQVAGLGDSVIDGLTAHETRPRCAAMGDGAFLNLRGQSHEPNNDPLASIRLYARAGQVISLSRQQLIVLDAVRAEMAGGTIIDPGDLIVALASAITEDLDPVVAALGDSIDACEETLDSREALVLRRRVNAARRTAIGLRRFIYPQRSALEKLATMPCPWLDDDDRVKLASAADRAARMGEELESIRERAALVHETLTDLRAELIDQRSLLIAVAAMVFLPLTFLTGLLGMNVAGIPYANEPWAFWSVVGISTTLALGIAGYFIRQHWFR